MYMIKVRMIHNPVSDPLRCPAESVEFREFQYASTSDDEDEKISVEKAAQYVKPLVESWARSNGRAVAGYDVTSVV